MSRTKLSTAVNDAVSVMYNPGAMQDAMLDTMLGGLNGEDYEILDPNNPLIWSLEASATLAMASIESHTTALRKRNPVMAVDMQDLFGHMSEEDWLDVYAQPARGKFCLYVDLQEVINKAAPKNSLETRKLIIPQDSEFIVGGYTFTIQYPIEILVLPNKGIQVVYNTEVESPIVSLASRSLNWSIVTLPVNGLQVDMIAIEIPALQYKIMSQYDSITKGISWKQKYRFTDQFFTARVWNYVNGENRELKTTFSDEVIPVNEVTAQLRCLDGELEVYIPDIYVREGMIKGDIRVDIYTTKGSVEIDLPSYSVSEYSFILKDINKRFSTTFTSPLKSFASKTLIGTDVTRGGRPALTFAELQSRVIDNGFSGRVVPISEPQLINTASDMGFTVTKSIDYVTKRIYLATAESPLPAAIPGLSTPIGSINGILETSVEDLINVNGIKDNGKRITILPSTIYEYVNGLVKVDSRSLQDYMRLDPNQRVSLVNGKSLLFTPWHYVLDLNGDIVEERAYYLSRPAVTNKRYVETNHTLALDVTTAGHKLTEVDDGYVLTVKTVSGKEYKTFKDEQKHAQLSFSPRGYDDEYAAVNGKLLGHDENGEAIFEFHIQTNLDIDRNHDMVVENFIMVGDTASSIAMQLECKMNVIYAVSGYEPHGFRSSDIDSIYKAPQSDAKAISHEILTIKYGSHLPSLWTNARAISGTIDYKRYEEDVYETYPKDVYATDPATGRTLIEFEVVDGKTKAKMVIEHHAGDFRLDENGNKKLLHRAGSVVYGVDGKPEIKNPRKILRRLEMFLMDAKFAISDTEETKAYMDDVVSKLLAYILEDLPSIDTSLLEKTSLFFYPRTTMGLIDVLLGDGTTAKYDAENKFMVYYYLTSAARQNGDFLKTLAETTRSAILVNLNGETVSTSAITEEIRRRMGNEIVDVEMGGLGDNGDQKLFTVTDSRFKPTLGKKLRINPDKTLSIVDDISISYNSHEVKK